MLEWGSKMRPPFLGDFWSRVGGGGKTSQDPPPPVKGGTGVFFNRHGTPKSPILERL